jgi:hypothetical protein
MRKYAFKAVVMIASLILVAALLAGCGSPALVRQPVPSTTTSPANPVRVAGTCEMTIEGNKAKVACKTDVMDGAVFKLSIASTTGTELAKAVIVKSGDNLNAEFDLTNITEKTIYGFATCAPEVNGKQPDTVYEKYGAKFQNIQSDALIWTTEVNMLVFSSGEKTR